MGGSHSAAADSEETAPKEESAQTSEELPVAEPELEASCLTPKKGSAEEVEQPEAEIAVESAEPRVASNNDTDPVPIDVAADPEPEPPLLTPEQAAPEDAEEEATNSEEVHRWLGNGHTALAPAPGPDPEHGDDAGSEEHPATTDAPEAKNARSLEQQMSLRPTDDERTEISKKISWILRHGAKKVNVNIDENGWVNVTDLLHSDILGGTTEDKLLAMINESNVQKTRYEMEDDPNVGKRIRAISKSRRNAAQREMREKERRERDKKREEEAREREARDREQRERERQERQERERERDPIPPPPRERENPRRREPPAWWDDGWQDGPTYDQQIKEGFLPVYQGNRLIAMAKQEPEPVPVLCDVVKPGRRAPHYGGKGFDPSKGFDGKGFDGKGFEGKGFDGKGFDGRGFDMHKGENKGERKGRGKDEKGRGKFGDDHKGFHPGKGDGYKGDGARTDGYRGEEKEEEHREEALKERYRSSRQLRWRACSEKDVIVRVGLGTETEIVGTLTRNSLVAQVGEDKMLKNGIARMFIESIDPIPGIKGWVTRSAEAAGGPIFFKSDRPPTFPPRERVKDTRGSKGNQPFGGEKGEKGGKAFDGKGKARRPIGEGDGGAYTKPILPGPDRAAA